MKRNENFDEKLRERMKNFSKNPPPAVWDGIREGMQEEKRKVLIPVFWRFAAGIAILIATAVGFYRLVPEDGILQENMAEESNPARESFSRKSSTVPEPPTASHAEQATEQGEESKAVAEIQQETTEKTAEPAHTLPAKPEMKTVKVEKTELTEEPVFVLSSISDLPEQIIPAHEVHREIRPEKTERVYSWDDLYPEEIFPEESERRARLSLSAFASPLYSYRDLSNVSGSLNEYFNDSESGKLSYSGGMNIGYAASDRLSIHTGIVYNRMGLEVNNILAVADLNTEMTNSDDFYRGATSPYVVANSVGNIDRTENGNTGFDYASLNSKSTGDRATEESIYLTPEGMYDPASNYVDRGASIEQFFEYLEVPLNLRYRIIDRKIGLSLLGGLSTNFLVGNSVRLSEDGEVKDIGSTSQIQTVNYSSNLGIGFNYDIRRNIRFVLEPQFKYYLNSINRESLINNRPYSIGVYTGISYLF